MAGATKRKATHATAPAKKVARSATKPAKAQPVKPTDDDEEWGGIGDDAEDLMEAAQTGKYDFGGDDDDDDEEGDWESQSDEDMESDPEQVNKLSASNATDAAGGELEGLKETYDLFKSNIFKLQIDELLQEVSVPYDKHKSLKRALEHLKQTMEGIPQGQDMLLTEFMEAMAKKDVAVPLTQTAPPSDAKYKFCFEKPASVSVVGSYALKAVAKTKAGFNVDLSVEMPNTVFQEKDTVNHRYFYKRACYLAVLAQAIRDTKKGFELEYSLLDGDAHRPILLVKPPKDRSPLDFHKSKCVIRILPCIASDTFPYYRLAPGRNNVRTANDDETTERPTPQYNASLLQDTTFSFSLAFLYQHSKNCAAFTDAVLLSKVWLYQRRLAQTTGFTPFLFSVIMGYLLQGGMPAGGKKLSAGHSSYQLIRGTFDYLATHDITQNPILIGQSDHAEFTEKHFVDHYEVVIVDPTGTVNLASQLTLSGWKQVQYEAKRAMDMLNDPADQFDCMFLKNVGDNKLKYDHLLSVRVPEEPLKTYDAANAAEYPIYAEFFAKQLGTILTRGLTDRAHLVAVQYFNDLTWQLGGTASIPETTLNVGIILNAETYARLVDQGPTAQEKEKADAFRAFWGDKAELRRFKDGSILESVVWETRGYEQRSLIVQQIIQHLVQRHFNVSRKKIHYWAGQLYSYTHLADTVPDHFYNRELEVTGFQPVMGVYQEFAKRLRSVDDALPILISNLYPVSPALRYTSVHLPHPIDFNKAARYPTSLRYVEALDVLVQLENSARWPDDPTELHKVKYAFYCKMAEQLQNAGASQTHVVVEDSLETNPLADRGHLDVYFQGYIFRCHIYLAQEADLLKNLSTRQKETDEKKKTLAQLALDRHLHQFRYRRTHAYAIQAACAKYPALSSTIRLAKRWLGAHLLTRHVSEELCELLCAHIFKEPYPWSTPTSTFAGFVRFLHLLATWDWRKTPLVVDLQSEISTSDRDAAFKHFTDLRGRNPQMTLGALCVATPDDLEGLRWTRHKPSKPVAGRLQMLAQAALGVLNEAITQGSEKALKRIFATPLEDYHAVFKFKPSLCTRYYENLRPEADPMMGKSQLDTKVYAKLDPITEFVDELERIYGDTVLFFHDTYGGDRLAVVWNPLEAEPRKFKVANKFNSRPVDINAKGKLEGTSDLCVPNFDAIAAEIARIGGDLIEQQTN